MFPIDIITNFVSQGWVKQIDMEDIEMYTLTPEGKEEQQRRFDSAGDTAAVAQALLAAYQPFLELNTEFKELCNCWQLKDGSVNDHCDITYDQQQLDALASLADRAQPVLVQLAEALPRLARYNSRLQEAAQRAAAGETKMFTGVMCGSYHDIWMELHEDLMLLQGIDRAEEGSF